MRWSGRCYGLHTIQFENQQKSTPPPLQGSHIRSGSTRDLHTFRRGVQRILSRR
ncbi:hypothetical protein ANCCAN_05414 [Ancylostoma caninum]|uniref:Uncharacterized protein n=1 Tax=Ancylostoma caninum TaxID=29170 RepID=A0A368GW39_ANCCA|nr:hypothetical protein ANCCAN_05414 [Ancylostoma caninum]